MFTECPQRFISSCYALAVPLPPKRNMFPCSSIFVLGRRWLPKCHPLAVWKPRVGWMYRVPTYTRYHFLKKAGDMPSRFQTYKNRPILRSSSMSWCQRGRPSLPNPLGEKNKTDSAGVPGRSCCLYPRKPGKCIDSLGGYRFASQSVRLPNPPYS